ncbi:MAG TPA: Na-translocating system protein MpsC family protein [Solirubrobacterales bacterium]|nr:Na-translocating system protein MpsC family protein [Solirubrobacterales bacterium]
MSELVRDLDAGEKRIDVEISREIVRIHAHYYGRGPTKSKTYVNDEVILCILGDIYTPSELMLIEAGRFGEVRLNRTAFQDTVEPIMRESVERIAGRAVESFFSQISPDGRASEVFVLVGGSGLEGAP